MFDNTAQLQQVGLAISCPPTQAEMQAIVDKLAEVITRRQGGWAGADAGLSRSLTWLPGQPTLFL